MLRWRVGVWWVLGVCVWCVRCAWTIGQAVVFWCVVRARVRACVCHESMCVCVCVLLQVQRCMSTTCIWEMPKARSFPTTRATP